MVRKILYGAVLGSLAFAASEAYVSAEATPSPRPHAHHLKRFHFNKKTDVTRGKTAPELGFVVDILDMRDWKSLRKQVEKTPFSSLADTEAAQPKKDPGGGS